MLDATINSCLPETNIIFLHVHCSLPVTAAAASSGKAVVTAGRIRTDSVVMGDAGGMTVPGILLLVPRTPATVV